jgi:hypothetical protein
MRRQREEERRGGRLRGGPRDVTATLVMIVALMVKGEGKGGWGLGDKGVRLLVGLFKGRGAIYTTR